MTRPAGATPLRKGRPWPGRPARTLRRAGRAHAGRVQQGGGRRRGEAVGQLLHPGAGPGAGAVEDELAGEQLGVAGATPVGLGTEARGQTVLDLAGDLARRVLRVLQFDQHGQVRAAVVAGVQGSLLQPFEDVQDALGGARALRVGTGEPGLVPPDAALQARGEHRVLAVEQLVHRPLGHARRPAQGLDAHADAVAVGEPGGGVEQPVAGGRLLRCGHTVRSPRRGGRETDRYTHRFVRRHASPAPVTRVLVPRTGTRDRNGEQALR